MEMTGSVGAKGNRNKLTQYKKEKVLAFSFLCGYTNVICKTCQYFINLTVVNADGIKIIIHLGAADIRLYILSNLYNSSAKPFVFKQLKFRKLSTYFKFLKCIYF